MTVRRDGATPPGTVPPPAPLPQPQGTRSRGQVTGGPHSLALGVPRGDSGWPGPPRPGLRSATPGPEPSDVLQEQLPGELGLLRSRSPGPVLSPQGSPARRGHGRGPGLGVALECPGSSACPRVFLEQSKRPAGLRRGQEGRGEPTATTVSLQLRVIGDTGRVRKCTTRSFSRR